MAARKGGAEGATGAQKKKFDAEVRKIRTNLQKVKDALSKKEKQARLYIQKNPAKAVAMVAAAGVLAGVLVTLIAKRKKKA